MERSRRVANHAVRDEGGEVERRLPARIRKSAGEHLAPGLRQHAHLPRPLGLRRRQTLFARACARVVDGAEAPPPQAVGEPEVVTASRLELDESGAPNGVDPSVSGRDRAAQGFLLAQPELVAPVEALAVGAIAGVLELEPPADV